MSIPHKNSLVLLVAPPFKALSKVYPLGLGYLGAVLEENNYAVKIINYQEKGSFNIDVAIDEILEINPAFLGFTVNSVSYIATKKMIAKIKERGPKIRILVGGPHVSTLPKESLEHLLCDFVVVGEGEEIILEIIRRVESGINSFNDLKGLAFWDDKSPVLNPGINIIQDLDVLPFPIRTPLCSDMGGDMFALKSPVASILTSRGCPHKCTFCASHFVHGRNFRKRSAKNVVDEIELLVNKHGVKEINIVDDSFSEDRQHAVSICEEIVKRKLNICWRTVVGLRADTLDRDLVGAFKASGCYKIGLGIESFSTDTLECIKKPLVKERLKERIALVKDFQIETVGYFILGLPGDTENSVLETIRFAADSDLDYPYFSRAVPLPGTDIFKRQYPNLDVVKINWDNFDFNAKYEFRLSQVLPERLKRYYVLAYFFSYLKFRRIRRVLKDIIRSKRTGFFKAMRFILQLLRNAV